MRILTTMDKTELQLVCDVWTVEDQTYNYIAIRVASDNVNVLIEEGLQSIVEAVAAMRYSASQNATSFGVIATVSALIKAPL